MLESLFNNVGGLKAASGSWTQSQPKIIPDLTKWFKSALTSLLSFLIVTKTYYISVISKLVVLATFHCLKLLSSVCFIFFLKKAFQKFWKMLFYLILKKIFSFLRYSTFCNFFSSFPQPPDSKGQMKLK